MHRNGSQKEPQALQQPSKKLLRITLKNPRWRQGAPKSSQGAPRDRPGAPNSLSFCAANSLRDPRDPPSTARELPGTPKQHPRVLPSAHCPPKPVHKATQNHSKSSKGARKRLQELSRLSQDAPIPPQVYWDSAPTAPPKSVDTQSLRNLQACDPPTPQAPNLQASEPPSLQVCNRPSCQAFKPPKVVHDRSRTR